MDNPRLSRQIEAAEAAAGGASATASLEDIAALSTSADLFERLTREVELLLEANAPLQRNNVLMMILEAIYRGGPYDRALFGLVNPEHTHIHGRLALGEGADSLRERFRFPLAPGGGPSGSALRGGRELFLPGYGGASFAEMETLKMLGAASFGLLPVQADRVLVGCLYFDHLHSTALPDSHRLRLLRRLRELTAAAIEKSRSTAAV